MTGSNENTRNEMPSRTSRGDEHEHAETAVTPGPHYDTLLTSHALLALRAAAVLGSEFDVAGLAAILRAEPVQVLEWLQMAADAGARIADDGSGSFTIPRADVTALRTSTLPSLARAWAAQVPRGASEQAAPPRVATHRAPEPRVAADAARADSNAKASSTEDPAVRHAPPRIGHAAHHAATVQPVEPLPAVAAAERRHPYEELFEAQSTAAPVNPAAPALASSDRDRPDPRRDTATPVARTAAASESQIEAAIAEQLAAAQHAAGRGLAVEALTRGRAALAALAQLTETPERRRMRAGVLCELGTLQSQSAGPGTDFTLTAAAETLVSARDSLRDGDPPALRAEVSRALAGVYCDIGDLPSLESALDELTSASRALVAAGDATLGARLLSDQAAVYVRLGDPVRAAYLLEQSRSVFERRAASEPSAAMEMADTDHLLARLPLHVAARRGREADAIEMGLDRCDAAEQGYQRLGETRKLARVWETRARLQLRAGRREAADKTLAAAIETQESLGDLLGLARSTGAMAEVLASSGRHGEALRLLADSVSLNLEKGSPGGLAFNRRSLTELARNRTSQPRDALDGVARQLIEAESILGPAIMPGDRA